MSDEQKEAGVFVAKPTQIVGTPNSPVYYTNIAGLAISPEEVTINFGLINPNPDNPGEITSVARIYMTPGHAKRLTIALQKAIENYEQNFGKIVHNVEDFLTSEVRKQVGLPDK